MDDRRKNYRAWDAQHSSHEPVSPREALPEDDLVFFLLDLIPQMDLTPFHHYYAQELRGQPPFDVTMMVILLVYAQYRPMENGPDGLNLFWFRLLSRRFEPWRRVSLCCWAIKLP